MLPRLPGQIERVQRDAVAAPAGAGVEAHEAERLRLGGVEHLPDVDAHPVVDHLELVDQGDVHGAEDVLGELGRLGRPRRGHAHRAGDHEVVERLGQVPRRRVDAADHFGRGGGGVVLAPRILALGGKGEEVVAPALEARFVQDPLHQLVGGAGVGGALEHHELAGAQRRAHLPGRGGDVGHVGLALGGERCRHADEDGVGLVQPREVGGGGEEPGAGHGGDAVGAQVLDVALAAREAGGLVGVHVEAEDADAPLHEGHGQGQAHVAEADDAHRGGLGVNFGFQILEVIGRHGRPR